MPPVRMNGRKQPQALPGMYAQDAPDGHEPPALKLSRRETFWIMWGALKAAFLIAGIMGAVMILFVAFLRFIWRV